MLDFELIKLVLISGLASSIITTATVQKIKENLKSKKTLMLNKSLCEYDNRDFV